MDDKNTHNQSKLETKKPLILIMLLICFISLIALYINFQFSYKFSGINQKISELNLKQEKIITLSKNTAPIIMQQPVEIDERKENYSNICNLDIGKFIQEYYLMKTIAQKGQDFSTQALALKQHPSLPENLKESINNLIKIAPNNKNIHTLKHHFNILIRSLYKSPTNTSLFNLKDFFFVRKIGQRALNDNDLDSQIFQIQQALEQNNLIKVSKILQIIQHDALNNFRLEIETQLVIKENFEEIEEILQRNLVSK